ncbi:MAG: hypothetical protein AAGB31_16055, partial [Bdellovibrio sp.]
MAMTTFGVTLFVSVSAFATGPAPLSPQQELSFGSSLEQKKVPQIDSPINERKLKVMGPIDTNEVSSGKTSPLKASDLLKTTKTLRGGDGSGGADSALDPKGQKRLLDLIEQDELDYFTHLYDPNQDAVRKYLVRLHFTYFGRNVDIGYGNTPFGRCAEIPYKYWHATGGNETFVKILLKAFGLENSKIEFISSNFGYCPDLAAPREYFNFGSISPETKVLKWAFTDLPLESIHDEGEIRISRPESKRQLAIQKDGLVVIQRQEFDALDNESKAALFTHEALLYTVSVLNPDLIEQQGTSLIRTYNRRLLRFFREHDRLYTTQFPITLESVVEAFQALKIPVTKK